MTPRRASDSGETIDLAHVRVRLSGAQIWAAVALVIAMISGAASSAWWLAQRLEATRAEVGALRVDVLRQWADHEMRLRVLEARGGVPAGGLQ